MPSFSRYSVILLLLSVAFLVGMGLVMLGSTSPWAEPDSMRYSHLKKQTVFLILGVVTAIIAGWIPLRFYEKWTWAFVVVSVIMLVLCFVPGFRYEVNGSSRWILVPLLGRFQPSEPSKIATTMVLAWWMVHIAKNPEGFFKGYLLPFIVLGIPAGLIFLETDMGTTAVMIGSAFLLLYVAGTRGWLLAATAIVGVVGLILFVQYSGGNRAERLLAFRDLEASKLDYGLQQWRSLLAFANGGVQGVGLGNGAEKHGYLPFAHTDFIFPIIGEELGLRATLAVILAFVMIAISGILIAQRSKSKFGCLVAIGLTANIVIPGAMNIAVATAMLPNTGLPLPLVSYGGTNLLFTLLSVGIIVGIYFRSPEEKKEYVSTIRERRIMRV